MHVVLYDSWHNPNSFNWLQVAFWRVHNEALAEFDAFALIHAMTEFTVSKNLQLEYVDDLRLYMEGIMSQVGFNMAKKLDTLIESALSEHFVGRLIVWFIAR